MYIYALLILIWMIIKIAKKPKPIGIYSIRFRYALMLAIPLILIMGLRHISVGVDTMQYQYRFDHAKDFWDSSDAQIEIGYTLINYFICDVLYLNYQAFLLISSSFYCIVLALFISKYSTNVLMSFFLHLTIGLFTMSMSGIRQSMAVSFCILAYMIVGSNKQRLLKYVMAIALNLIAITIHTSSIIFLPFLFLGKLRLSRVKAFLLILFGLSSQLIKTYLIPYSNLIMFVKYEKMDFESNYSANILVYIIPLLISLFCWFFAKVEGDGRYSIQISHMFVFVSFVLFFINLMSLNNQLGRLSYYFIYSYYILIPYAFSSMKLNSKNILQPFAIALCLAYFIIGSIGGILHIDNYLFFWEDALPQQ